MSRTASGTRWTWRVVHGALWVALWVVVLSFPEETAADGLDPSWRAIFAHDWLVGAEFGVDTIFTYGPLTTFVEPQAGYVPELFVTRVVSELLVKALAVVGLALLAGRLRRGPFRLLLQLLLLAMAPLLKDALLLLLLVSWPLAVLDGRRVPIALVLLLLALLGFVKFTFLVLAVPCAGALVLAPWCRGDRQRAAGVAIAYAAWVVVAWVLVAGQPLGNLATWFRNSLAIATGYNAASALDGDPRLLADAVTTLAALGVAIALRLVPRDATARLGALVAASALFLTWKAGFVRQDHGHTLMFFPVAAVLGAHLAANAWRGTARTSRVAAGLALLAVVTASVGTFRAGTLMGYDGRTFRPVWLSVMNRNLFALTDPGAFRAAREAERARLVEEHALPRTAAVVGDEPVDLVAHEQGVLYLNGFTVRHRPAIQGYVVTEPHLQGLNGRFLAGPDGPRHVLYELQPTGRFFPTVQDSQAVLALLHRFRPVLSERGRLLLSKRGDVPESLGASVPDGAGDPATGEGGDGSRGAPPAAPSVDDRFAPWSVRDRRSLHASLGAWIDLGADDAGATLAALDLRPSLAGRLRALLFRPAGLGLEVRLADGQLRRHRISAPIVRAPFLLDPYVETTFDVLRLYAGEATHRVAAIRVTADEPGAWDPVFDVHLATAVDLVPGAPLALPTALVSDALAALFPRFDAGPGRLVEARRVRNDVRPEGELLAIAPAALVLELPAGRHRMRGTFQARRDTWSEGGATDGMVFGVRVVGPATDGGPSTDDDASTGGVRATASDDDGVTHATTPRVVWERLVRPVQVEADRAPLPLDVLLELDAPVRVEVFTDPGPAGHAGWDRGCWSDLRVEPSP